MNLDQQPDVATKIRIIGANIPDVVTQALFQTVPNGGVFYIDGCLTSTRPIYVKVIINNQIVASVMTQKYL
jgi:hypothetical protein